ncbi:conjugal transfer protein TrbD [Photobacterium damselae]|uniref:conjugal transfer protein TrbD n=1 Tax=Photobacterium damselae TaxID=38293 RepID=UPI0002B6143E|nr:conjugal transfer protein TrbD [Photobacterium damselae]AGE91756.1 TrbD [Photobacterium damselae subsp. piscicida DI21]MBA5685055.1 VirB3 family type IV secretion system protein [Photobacterium damselae subsp. damselae]TLS70595.1 conjugal transfer protein TrbD [Photobacterium damselae subsp. damselae]TLS77179.1 conjugal transfer protein TrbD [Photobacterium damselae subsp. damselae]TLS84157.1 conjugal transfer protein TrbD [Photobacterium damselae subsp. damselae]
MSALKKVRIFQFSRGHLILGGERELVILTAGFSFVFIAILQNIMSAIFGILLWFCLIPIFQYMGKVDPQLSKVYKRYARYQRYYPAHGMKNHGDIKK